MAVHPMIEIVKPMSVISTILRCFWLIDYLIICAGENFEDRIKTHVMCVTRDFCCILIDITVLFYSRCWYEFGLESTFSK